MSTVNRHDTDHSPLSYVILIQSSVETANLHSCVYFKREVAMLLVSKIHRLLCSIRDVIRKGSPVPDDVNIQQAHSYLTISLATPNLG